MNIDNNFIKDKKVFNYGGESVLFKEKNIVSKVYLSSTNLKKHLKEKNFFENFDEYINKYKIKLVETKNINSEKEKKLKQLKLLNFTFIPKIHDLLYYDSFCGFNMGYVEGKTIYSILNDFDLGERINLLTEIHAIREGLNTFNIYLTDYNFKNFIQSDNKIKLVDFDSLFFKNMNNANIMHKYGKLFFTNSIDYSIKNFDNFCFSCFIFEILTGMRLSQMNSLKEVTSFIKISDFPKELQDAFLENYNSDGKYKDIFSELSSIKDTTARKIGIKLPGR